MRAIGGLIALFILVGGLAIESAAAVGSVLYLRGHAVPSSPMSNSAPPPGSLPNFDPRRDDFPGLLVQKGSGTADEGDPTKFQEWSHPVGGETLSIDEFVIWAAPKDLNEDKTMIFNVMWSSEMGRVRHSTIPVWPSPMPGGARRLSTSISKTTLSCPFGF